MAHVWDIESMRVHKHMWCVCVHMRVVRVCMHVFCYWQATVLRVNVKKMFLDMHIK